MFFFKNDKIIYQSERDIIKKWVKKEQLNNYIYDNLTTISRMMFYSQTPSILLSQLSVTMRWFCRALSHFLTLTLTLGVHRVPKKWHVASKKNYCFASYLY